MAKMPVISNDGNIHLLPDNTSVPLLHKGQVIAVKPFERAFCILPQGQISLAEHTSDPLTDEQLEQWCEAVGFRYQPSQFMDFLDTPSQEHFSGIGALLDMVYPDPKRPKYLEAAGRYFWKSGHRIDPFAGCYSVLLVKRAVAEMEYEAQDWVFAKTRQPASAFGLRDRSLIELYATVKILTEASPEKESDLLVSHDWGARFQIEVSTPRELLQDVTFQVYGDATQHVRQMTATKDGIHCLMEFVCDHPLIVWVRPDNVEKTIIHFSRPR